MWRLTIGEGGNDPYIYSTNDFVGRQIWEFDAEASNPKERAEVEDACLNFYNHRFQVKPCSDLLWRMKVLVLDKLIRFFCAGALHRDHFKILPKDKY